MTRIQKFRFIYCLVIISIGLWASIRTGHQVFLWAMIVTSGLVLASGAIKDDYL